MPNTVRNLAYPPSNPTPDYADAWGRPTLAGAWAVHAAIALALMPVYLLVLRGLVGPPVTVVVVAALACFLVALLRQL